MIIFSRFNDKDEVVAKPKETQGNPNIVLKETIEVLREIGRGKDKTISKLENEIAALENRLLRFERIVTTAEEDREVLYDIVRLLAAQIGNDTAPGRKVRQIARQLLEARKITPPATLGSSRSRKKRR